MEKRLKVAEFATLVGIVPKTVYKMIVRNEILTVTEKVNNRNVTLIVTSDEQIAEFRKNFSKDTVNVGNYYENVTENYHSQKDNYGYETVKDNYSNNFNAEVIERIISLSESYNEQLREVNDELITAKSRLLLLEDKKNTAEGDKSYWRDEFFKQKEENKALNLQLEKRNKTLLIMITISITLLFTFIGALITYNISKPQAQPAKQEIIEQPIEPVQQPVKYPKKKIY